MRLSGVVHRYSSPSRYAWRAPPAATRHRNKTCRRPRRFKTSDRRSPMCVRCSKDCRIRLIRFAPSSSGRTRRFARWRILLAFPFPRGERKPQTFADRVEREVRVLQRRKAVRAQPSRHLWTRRALNCCAVAHTVLAWRVKLHRRSRYAHPHRILHALKLRAAGHQFGGRARVAFPRCQHRVDAIGWRTL